MLLLGVSKESRLLTAIVFSLVHWDVLNSLPIAGEIPGYKQGCRDGNGNPHPDWW